MRFASITAFFYALTLSTAFAAERMSPRSVAMNAAPKTADVSRSGSWFDPSHNGEGFVVQFIDDSSGLVYWFTYDESGNQRWFTALGDVAGDRLQFDDLLITEGGRFGPAFDPADVIRTSVGTLSITFFDGQSARADYEVDGVSGSQDLVRLTTPVEALADLPTGAVAKSGSWFDPEHNGEGFAIEILEGGIPLAYWFTYDTLGNQAWMVGLGTENVANGSFELSMLQPVGGRFGPNFDPADVVRQPAGSSYFTLDCDAGRATLDAAASDFVDTDLAIQQLIGVGDNVCSDPALTTLFPIVEDRAQLPGGQATTQLDWLLDQTIPGNSPTDAQLQDRFDSTWFESHTVAETRAIIADIQTNYPSARLTDPIGVTPMQIVGLVTGSNGREAFTVLETRFASGKIFNLFASNFGFGAGTVISAADSGLNLEQAADQFVSLSGEPSFLVARVSENQCVPMVSRSATTLRSTASIFKIWILGGVADALDDGSITRLDEVLRLDRERAPGGPVFDEANGTVFTIDELSRLMLGISDNTATDLLLDRVGRDRIDSLHAEYGHTQPDILAPQLGISEQFHLFFSFSSADANSYVNGSESFQRDFLSTRIEPLGSVSDAGGGFFNESLFIDGSWRASPMDICGALARHRLHDPGSDAAAVVERSLGAQAAQPRVREKWDRVWYKGGSLVSGANGQLVLTHAWLLENEGEDPFVVVAMANDRMNDIDSFAVQSVLGRVLELAAQ